MGGRGSSSGKKTSGPAISKTDARLLMGLPESERGDIYFHRKGDPYLRNGSLSDLQKEAQGKNLHELATNSAVLINESLNFTSGTEKQIDYAKRLAKSLFSDVLDNMYRAYTHPDVPRSAVFENAKAQGVAPNMDAVMRYTLRQSEAYQYLMSEKDAGKAIDWLKRNSQRIRGMY